MLFLPPFLLRRRAAVGATTPDTGLTPANETVNGPNELASALADVPSNTGATYIIDLVAGNYGDFNVGTNYNKGTTRVHLRGQVWNNLPVFSAFHAVGAQRLDLSRVNIINPFRDRFGFPTGNTLTSTSVRFDNAVDCLIRDVLFKNTFIALDIRNTTDVHVEYCSFVGYCNDAIRCYTNTNGEIHGLRLRNLFGTPASDLGTFPAFTPLHTGYNTSSAWAIDVRRSDQYGYSETANVIDLDGIPVSVTATTKDGRHPDFIQFSGYASDCIIEDCEIVGIDAYHHGILVNNDASVSPSDISTGVVIKRCRITNAFVHGVYFKRCDATCGIEDTILRPTPTKTWALNTPAGSLPGFMDTAFAVADNTTADVFVTNCVHPATVNTAWWKPDQAVVSGLVASDTAVPTGWDGFDVANGRVGQFGWYYHAAGAPAAVGSISDIYLAEGGTRTRDLSAAFSGGGTYSLVSAPTGVTINSTTGQLSVDTATSGRMALTTFTVRKTLGGNTADQSCKLLVGPPIGYSSPNSVFTGMDDAAITAELANQAADGGKFSRFELNWNDVEPVSSSAQVWTLPDKLVTAAKAAGMTPMLIPKNCAPWASVSGDWNAAPTNTGDYASFVGRAADHYSGALEVRHWEIWNEPNGTGAGGFLNVTNGDWKWKYPDMALFASGELKSRSSANNVIVGSFTNVPTPGDATHHPAATAMQDIIDIMNEYHTSFAASFPDFQLSTHPYCPEGVEADLAWDGFGVDAATRAVLDAERGNTTAKVWFTEWGAPTDGNPSDPWFPPITEAEQAAQCREALKRCCEADLIGRVQALIVHRHTDKTAAESSDTGNIETFFGVRRRADGSRKPAADFLREYGTLNT